MKLAKKMLACAMALAMVAALALTAFAAPAINVTATDAVVGGTITVKVAATGVTGLESGDLILNYDPAVLEFVKRNVSGMWHLFVNLHKGKIE